MVPQKTAAEGSTPAKQVNSILQNLRGEYFRHTRNAQRKPASGCSLSSHWHNQPTLPTNLIYPSPAPTANSSWVPGPSPPKSWRSTLSSYPSPKSDVNITNTAAWREQALSLFFTADIVPSSCSPDDTRFRQIYPDPSPIPRLTLLCLQLIRYTCRGTDLAEVVPYIPLHLRRALLRYTAVHTPLSQIELDALCEGATHVDAEYIVIGPHNTLRTSLFRKHTSAPCLGAPDRNEDALNELWDATPTQDSEPLVLRSLCVLSSPLSATTMLALTPTITYLALINVPHQISLPRLPTICPLLVFLDLSYNVWLNTARDVDGGAPMLEQVEWAKWRKLEVLGLRGCSVTPKALLELNRGRWEDITIIQ